MIAPAKTRRGIRICTLATATTAELQGDLICGEWGKRKKPFFGLSRGRTLIEQFLNRSSDAEAILRFTRRYGPICELPPEPGPYCLDLADWRELQDVYRIAWRGMAGGAKPSFPGGQWIAPTEVGDRLVVRFGEVLYFTHSLESFLRLEACCLPLERLRVCARPDCQNPYFVARHLRQNYCDERCAEWGQRQWKQKWWAEHGDEWRKNRQRPQPKKASGRKAGKQNGSQKTR
jgi:hypothetical protein